MLFVFVFVWLWCWLLWIVVVGKIALEQPQSNVCVLGCVFCLVDVGV
jgi:hypothetical protein